MTSVTLSKEDLHKVNFCIMYNHKPDDSEILNINSNVHYYNYHFKNHDISLTEFKNVFYQNDFEIFNINELYKEHRFLNFGKQIMIDEENTDIEIGNLVDSVISAYEQEYGITRNNFNPLTLMMLTKDILKYESLYDLCNINVHHQFKQLGELLNNYDSLNDKITLNLMFIYSNPLFKNIEITYNFNYVIDLLR